MSDRVEALKADVAKLRDVLEKARGKMQYMIDNGEWYAPEETVDAIDALLKETGNE